MKDMRHTGIDELKRESEEIYAQLDTDLAILSWLLRQWQRNLQSSFGADNNTHATHKLPKT